MTAGKRLNLMFDEDDLDAARQAGLLSQDGYVALKTFLAGRASTRPVMQAPPRGDGGPRFDVTHVLWYLGALIVMTAMGIFSTTAFAALGGGALTVTGLLYAAAFVLLGRRLWARGLHTPGGLAIAVAVSMMPLAIYGIEDVLGWWGSQPDPGHYRDFFAYVRAGWVFMEAGTVVAALVALYFWPFPFIVFVATFALWFMSMDLAMWIVGDSWGEFDARRDISLVFGCVMILLAWAIDLKSKRVDFAFWLHLFGTMCFWGGLSLHGSDNSLAKAIYCLINIGLVFFGVFLGRRVYAVFGSIGLMLYLGDLSWHVFDNVLSFSFALSVIGVAVIYLGLFLHRNEHRMAAWLAQILPPGVTALRPAHARQ
jgi:hypothetical protein